jgi:predicted DCC family thiol-disulfide oxidoreductase YuxK
MKTLTIFYDARCGLCRKFRIWLEAQPTRVRVEFLAYDSAEAGRRFPGLAAVGPGNEVVVLADDGRWWQGASAWITCLWATAAYHEWAFRLATPTLLPLVGRIVHLISENRLTISRLLHLRTEAGLAAAIQSLPEAGCGDGYCPAFTNPPPQQP